MAGRNQDESEWMVSRAGRVGAEWDVRKWKSEIDRGGVCGTEYMKEWYGTKEYYGRERSANV